MVSKARVLCDACGSDVGLWQAAFTSECAHTFHLRCVSGRAACPECKEQWRDTPAVDPAPAPATPFSFTSTPASSQPSSAPLFRQQATVTASPISFSSSPAFQMSLSGSSPQTRSSSSLFWSPCSSLFVSTPAFGSSPSATSSTSLFASSPLFGSSLQTNSAPSFGSSLFGRQPPATPNPFWLAPVPPTEQSSWCCVCQGSIGRGQATVTSECNHTFHLRCFSGSVCPICSARWRDEVTVTRSLYLNPFSTPPQPTNTFPTSTLSRQSDNFTFAPPNTSHTPPLPWPSASSVSLFNFNDDEPVERPLEGWDTVPEVARDGVLVLETHCEHPAVARDAAQENFAVMVHAKAPVAPAEASKRAPLDLVTVLDVSSSMAGSKLTLLKQAMCFIIDKLGSSDRLSVVTFSCNACRIIRLTRMSDDGGRASAKGAVESLGAAGTTNIGDGLRVAAHVLDDRRHKNVVSSVILLSDGQDNHTLGLGEGCFGPSGRTKSFIDLVPHSLRRGDGVLCTPVHTFGFGTDHDARAMHAIAEVTGGTFSFIENQAVVQDTFAQCIGGLLSVAMQEARIAVECLHPGVRVRAVKSGRYKSNVDADGSAASVDVGELYAEEERRFLLLVDVPIATGGGAEDRDVVTRLIKASCTYKDATTGRTVDVVGEDAVVQRPVVVVTDAEPSTEVARERFRVETAEDIVSARAAAERGQHAEAARILDRRQEASVAAGLSSDARCAALVAELRELSARVANRREYEQTGRAFMLAGMNSHAQQRASTVQLFGSAAPFAAASSPGPGGVGAAAPGKSSSARPPYGGTASLFCTPAAFGATGSGKSSSAWPPPQAGGFSSNAFGGVGLVLPPVFGTAAPGISSTPFAVPATSPSGLFGAAASPPSLFGSATTPTYGAPASCFTFGYATPAMRSMVDLSRKTREQQQQLAVGNYDGDQSS